MKKAVAFEREQASKPANRHSGETATSHQQQCIPQWEWIHGGTTRSDGVHGAWNRPMGMGRAFSAGVNWVCRRMDRTGWQEADDTD
eukprot:5853542-Prorocentrum_lima.AAC.1